VDLSELVSSSTPQKLIVTAKNTFTIDDVLIGEVWLCSGQSNMEMGIYAVQKKENLPVDSQLRVFCLTKSASLTLMDQTVRVPKELVWDTSTGYWSTTPDAGTWGGFSAVGYLFGQHIRQVANRPVGMIGSYWGGTPAQSWTSLEALKQNPALTKYADFLTNRTDKQKARYPVVWADYVAAMRKWSNEVWEPDQKALRQWEADAEKAREQGTPEPSKPQPTGQRPQSPGNEGAPTTLYNAMIHPLIPYAIRGVIWYQGESNANDPVSYAPLFAAMIQDWRSRWNQGEFPFFFVQLAGFGASQTDPKGGRWAVLREAQSKALALPDTGMATAVDIGDEKDIHPKNKFEVARRLALLAQNRVYHQQVIDQGPTFDSMTIDQGRIRIRFKYVGGGLVIASPPILPGTPPNPAPVEVTGFEIAGEDQKWMPARAVIDGDSVVVQSDSVTAPMAVRYAWSDCPSCSLYSRDGLPAYPFRTDSWK
jgi:sialate O-acetylesterase